jgi:hypothetical protein
MTSELTFRTPRAPRDWLGDRGQLSLSEETVLSLTPEEQIYFLVNLQRLLNQGLFVASYKFALLLSLAKWDRFWKRRRRRIWRAA